MKYFLLLMFLAVPAMGEDVTGGTLTFTSDFYDKYVVEKEPELYCKKHGKIEHGEIYLRGEIEGKKVLFCWDCVIELLDQNIPRIEEREEDK